MHIIIMHIMHIIIMHIIIITIVTMWNIFDTLYNYIFSVSEEELQAEQDARTVFASGLPTNVTTKELYNFFEKAGRVNDISLISDRNSRRSKGFVLVFFKYKFQLSSLILININLWYRIGYIEYAEKASIPLALGLSGTLLNGHTVIIQTTMAEKNRVLTATFVLLLLFLKIIFHK
jgi:hypothetical protein